MYITRRISWILNRLHRMSIAEILHRFRHSLSSSIERIKLNYAWAPESKIRVSSSLDVIQPELIEHIRGITETSLVAKLLEGHISLFAYKDLYIGNPVQWHRDPLTGIVCPDHTYGKVINYRDENVAGDIKVLWELGRQQYLVPIAVDYCLTKNHDNLSVISEVINSWMRENPYGYGIHWCSSLEVAIRGISWSISHLFLKAAGLADGIFSLDLDNEFLRRQIYQHAYFIRHNLSLYSSANNHLIGELTGLHVICSVFDFGDRSEEWRKFSWSSILREAELQVWDDGVNKEQAIYYHCWVLEYLLINGLFARKRSEHVPDSYIDRISKMTQFILDLSPENGAPPQIGDADDGVAIQFDTQENSFYRDLIETNNVLAGTVNPLDVGIKARCYYILNGTEGGLQPNPVSHRAYPHVYSAGGYAALGSSDFHLVFDCGPLGYTTIAAHGHADALHFCLAIDGEWWIVDPGTCYYHSNLEWRDYFRGSLAHNVLVVDGKNQSDIGGPFMWTRHANCELEYIKNETETGRQIAQAWHDGYAQSGVAKVTRKVDVQPAKKIILLTDELSCSNPIEITLSFHLSPEISYQQTCPRTYLMKKKGSSRVLQIRFPEELATKAFLGDEARQLGWYSPCLGKRISSPTLQGLAKIQGTEKLITEITLL